MRAAPSSAVEASNSFDPKAVLRPHLLELAPYTPIEPFEVKDFPTSTRLIGIIYSGT